MHLSNEVVLRPRFKIELNVNNQVILERFESQKKTQKDFILHRIDDHVFIKIPKTEQHFWSPQLHLEIMEIDQDKSILYGLFGPNPTVWTLFMFLHFLVAALFIGFGIWAYTNWSLETDYTIQLFVTLLMVVIWLGLYAAGRIGKSSGKTEMQALYNFMQSILENQPF